VNPQALRGGSRTGDGLDTSTRLAPALSIEQAIGGTLIDRVSHSLLKSLMDLGDRRDLSLNSAGHERLEKGAFLPQREILAASPTFPRRLDGSSSLPFVGGHHTVDG
jgi:hypothetical protein